MRDGIARVLHVVAPSLKLTVIVGLVVTSGCLSNVASDDTAPTTTHETTVTDSVTAKTTGDETTEPREETTTGSKSDWHIEIDNVSADAPFNDSENLNGEHIELTNTGEQSVNMTGWTVEDEDNNTFHFPDGFVLAPNESVMIYSGSGQNTSNELYWNASHPIWGNDGDTIYVYNSNGEVCGMDCIRLVLDVQ